MCAFWGCTAHPPLLTRGGPSSPRSRPSGAGAMRIEQAWGASWWRSVRRRP